MLKCLLSNFFRQISLQRGSIVICSSFPTNISGFRKMKAESAIVGGIRLPLRICLQLRIP